MGTRKEFSPSSARGARTRKLALMFEPLKKLTPLQTHWNWSMACFTRPALDCCSCVCIWMRVCIWMGRPYIKLLSMCIVVTGLFFMGTWIQFMCEFFHVCVASVSAKRERWLSSTANRPACICRVGPCRPLLTRTDPMHALSSTWGCWCALALEPLTCAYLVSAGNASEECCRFGNFPHPSARPYRARTHDISRISCKPYKSIIRATSVKHTTRHTP